MAVAALGGYDVAHAGTVERLGEPRSRPPTGEPAPTLI
jgi:hypothetical protein